MVRLESLNLPRKVEATWAGTIRFRAQASSGRQKTGRLAKGHNRTSADCDLTPGPEIF